MSQTAAWLLSLLGLLLLTFLCFSLHRGDIEADLKVRSAAALASEGFPGIETTADGRDVYLRGSVPSEVQKARAGTRVSSILGVRTVFNELTVSGVTEEDAELRAEPFFALADTANRLVISGVIPDESARGAVLSRVAASYPGREITDRLSIRPGALSSWIAGIDEPLPRFRGVSGTEFLIEPHADGTPGIVVLRGSVPSEAEKSRMDDGVREVVRAPYTFRSELVVLTEVPRTDVQTDSPGDPDVLGAQAALREAFDVGAVEFQTGTSELTAASRTLLDQAAAVFTRFPTVAAEVQGHTDSEGGDSSNQDLSQRRAEAVRTYLAGHGVDASALSAIGYGESQPISDNDSADGRSRNRRVVFKLNRR